MKRIVPCMVATVMALACGAARASWTYDPSDGTLTDGVWTLHATLVKNTTDQLNVSGQKGSFNGTDPCPIDLTEIYDSSNNRYYAVSFACFNSYSGAWNEKKKIGSMLNPYKDKLTQFIAPDCHTLSESGCFMNCTALTTVRLNETVTSFAGDTFKDCASLESFYPRTLHVTSLPIRSFQGCSKLAGEFYLPDCTGNPGALFNGCSKIESVKMPRLEVIATSTFNGCSSLTNVVFSESLHTIDIQAFSGCSSLPGDIIRQLLHPGLTRLGTKNIFSNCTSFDGELVWNFPALTSTNVVGQSYFEGCTSLSKVTFKTSVLEIRGGAFLNIAPAAEMHMQAMVPTVGASSLGNGTGPFPRVYLKDNLEEWLTELNRTYHVMRKADFNNREWSDAVGSNIRTRANLVSRMLEDPLMCSRDATTGDVSVRSKTVLAFCMQRKSGNNNVVPLLYCFWVLREPFTGTRIMVQ